MRFIHNGVIHNGSSTTEVHPQWHPVDGGALGLAWVLLVLHVLLMSGNESYDWPQCEQSLIIIWACLGGWWLIVYPQLTPPLLGCFIYACPCPLQTKLAFIRGSNGILSFLRFQTFSKAHMLHTDMVLALGTGCWEDCYVFFPIWMDFLATSGRWKLPSWRFVTSFCFYRGSTPFERELPSYVTDVAASPAFLYLPDTFLHVPAHWFVEPHNLPSAESHHSSAPCSLANGLSLK